MAGPRDGSIEIRLLGAGETARLGRVADDVFDEPLVASALAAFVAAAGHACFLAMAGALVVGQVRGMVHQQPDRAPDLYIDNLGVAPGWQRRGIATRLVEALMDWGRDRGCETVWVATETDNETAQAFYASLGLSQRQSCVVLSHPLATLPRLSR